MQDIWHFILEYNMHELLRYEYTAKLWTSLEVKSEMSFVLNLAKLYFIHLFYALCVTWKSGRAKF